MQHMKPSLQYGHMPGPPSGRASDPESDADESLPPPLSVALPSDPEDPSVEPSNPVMTLPEHPASTKTEARMKVRIPEAYPRRSRPSKCSKTILQARPWHTPAPARPQETRSLSEARGLLGDDA